MFASHLHQLAPAILVVAVGAFAGCSGSGSGGGTGGAAGNAGTGATSGSGGSGGTGGSGASSGTGGQSGSPGTAQFDFKIDNGKSYCRSTDDCQPFTSISIKDSTGKLLGRLPGYCYRDCVTCEQLPCPGIACSESHGIEVTGETLIWDGSYFESGTCQGTNQCQLKLYAPPGKYTAIMCATPGELVDEPPKTQKQCQTSGPQECVEVSFDFPSGYVIGSLP